MKEFFWCEPFDPKETPCLFDAESLKELMKSHTRCIRHDALVLGYGKFMSKEAAQKHVRGED
jgi:hypothetical protein